jgi:hypothetical protein
VFLLSHFAPAQARADNLRARGGADRQFARGRGQITMLAPACSRLSAPEVRLTGRRCYPNSDPGASVVSPDLHVSTRLAADCRSIRAQAFSAGLRLQPPGATQRSWRTGCGRLSCWLAQAAALSGKPARACNAGHPGTWSAPPPPPALGATQRAGRRGEQAAAAGTVTLRICSLSARRKKTVRRWSQAAY